MTHDLCASCVNLLVCYTGAEFSERKASCSRCGQCVNHDFSSQQEESCSWRSRRSAKHASTLFFLIRSDDTRASALTSTYRICLSTTLNDCMRLCFFRCSRVHGPFYCRVYPCCGFRTCATRLWPFVSQNPCQLSSAKSALEYVHIEEYRQERLYGRIRIQRLDDFGSRHYMLCGGRFRQIHAAHVHERLARKWRQYGDNRFEK